MVWSWRHCLLFSQGKDTCPASLPKHNWKPLFRHGGRETAKMAQQVKAVATRSDDVGSVSRTYMVKGKT